MDNLVFWALIGFSVFCNVVIATFVTIFIWYCK